MPCVFGRRVEAYFGAGGSSFACGRPDDLGALLAWHGSCAEHCRMRSAAQRSGLSSHDSLHRSLFACGALACVVEAADRRRRPRVCPSSDPWASRAVELPARNPRTQIAPLGYVGNPGTRIPCGANSCDSATVLDYAPVLPGVKRLAAGAECRPTSACPPVQCHCAHKLTLCLVA